MSTFTYLGVMTAIRTAQELGNLIRSQRKAREWDQARLAREAGVSRQWIIEIEKGKPRAELQLVLRVMNVLGLSLIVEPEIKPQASESSSAKPQTADIDEIVDRYKSSPADAMSLANDVELQNSLIRASLSLPEPTWPLKNEVFETIQRALQNPAARAASRHMEDPLLKQVAEALESPALKKVNLAMENAAMKHLREYMEMPTFQQLERLRSRVKR